MKTTLEVKTRSEGDAIKRGLEDQETRAIVVLLGTLAALPDGTRQRVLEYVASRVGAT